MTCREHTLFSTGAYYDVIEWTNDKHVFIRYVSNLAEPHDWNEMQTL